MATGRNEIRSWLEAGKDQGNSHMIVVCDTFDYEDFPVYVSEDEDVNEQYALQSGKNMQKVMEVYSYGLSVESQLNEVRAFHFN